MFNFFHRVQETDLGEKKNLEMKMFDAVKVSSKFIQKWFGSFSHQFTVKDGVPPLKWSSIGGLPSNSNLNPDTGVLCCGPTYWLGGWIFDVIVTDSRGKSDTKQVNFNSSL